MATRVGNWLRRANGFQRLWFVLSMALLFYMSLINPFVIRGSNLSAYEYKWAVERNIKNPECQPYLAKKFAELQEPKYDSEGRSGCWHVYTHRRYNDYDGDLPLTLEKYDRTFVWDQWQPILAFSGIGFVVALVLSAIAYGLGKVVAWVVRGFRQPPST